MNTPMAPDWSLLPSVDRADVYKAGKAAATLERTPGGTRFAYRQDYLDEAGPPVATTLPVTGEPLVTLAGAVPPFFAGLLPEGRRLSAIRHAVKTSADDDLSLLLAVGVDAVGDVQVLPEGVTPYGVTPVLETADLSQVRFADLFARSTGADPDRVGIPGVQPKVSARMINLPVPTRDGQYILKLNPPEFPGLVEDEAFFLRAARSSDLEVVEAALVHDSEAETGLLVRRFDRLSDPHGHVTALAVEDACQLLGRYPADKYAVTSEQVGAALTSVTGAPLVAARTVIQQLGFAYLTGNGDAHAKNVAVLRSPDGEWRIAPAYDLPSSYPYGDTTMALSMGGRRKDLTRAGFVEYGKQLGVPERATRRVLDNLVQRVDLWLPELDTLPYDQGRIRKLRRAVQYRRRLLSSP